ncbi:hypothetical protein FJK96_18080 [Mycobacteroides chelonae]|uniref:Uncharacterized protein n=1 Tax=Mycobacteroides chelonae TaxID=1774 RepID=A0AB73U5Q1_MYCCH|nr:hypothetical protein FJK96_18080 [Mycobacteroides chelonae]
MAGSCAFGSASGSAPAASVASGSPVASVRGSPSPVAMGAASPSVSPVASVWGSPSPLPADSPSPSSGSSLSSASSATGWIRPRRSASALSSCKVVLKPLICTSTSTRFDASLPVMTARSSTSTLIRTAPPSRTRSGG